MEAHQDRYAVLTLCRVLKVSRSGYYQWCRDKTSPTPNPPQQQNQQMDQLIISTFQEHRRRYGVRRLVVELRAKGCAVSRYRIGRVLRQQGLRAIQPRSFVPRTTQSRHPYAISPNLLLDREPPRRPGEVWVGDITYVPLAEGRWAYLSVWLDRYSRRIVGWQLEGHMREELVVGALQRALNRSSRNPEGLIVHSDRGGQYAGREFRKLLQKKRILQSMSRADDPYDNAFAESCFSRLKAELLQGGAFDSLEDARTEIFEYIEMYYNSKRRHSGLDYKSPMEYENQYFYSLT